MLHKKTLVLALSAGLIGCATGDELGTSQQAVGSNHIVSCQGKLPRGFASKVAANGDALGHHFADVGFATVSTNNPAAYATGGCDVTPDVVVDWLPGEERFEANFGNPPTSGDDDFFFDLQWGHDAVNAPEAWAAGVTGAGVRVAVLDTGFDLDHPDLAPNINLGLSFDFTGEGLSYTLPDTFSHGTHTAGTIAAADNGFGTIGVAPDAELVLIKVLSDEGSGSFGDVLAGMIYATLVDADIASMSLGALFPRNVDTGPNKLTVAMNRVANFARQNGTTIIASAGNEAVDFDHTGNLISMPSNATGVLSISATAPVGWGLDPSVSLDNQSSYTNYGRSVISFSAPGGDFIYPGNELCEVSLVVVPCWALDLVFSTGNGGWYWSAGTSMAAPHAAGVAALILSEGNVSNHAQLEYELRQRADDLGQPGQDPTHGHGRVASGY